MPPQTKKAESRARGARKESAAAPAWDLRLYVAGQTARSVAALENLERIREQHLAGRYRIEVIDIYQQPTLARDEQIIAAPTLIKKLPAPLRRVIGSMVDREKVLIGLDLRPKKEKVRK